MFVIGMTHKMRISSLPGAAPETTGNFAWAWVWRLSAGLLVFIGMIW